MIDIVILCLRGDEQRADAILGALGSSRQSGKYRTRLIAADPMDSGWVAARQRAVSADCVVMCWGSRPAVETFEPFVALGAELLRMGTAISVELDPGSLPPEIGGGDCYPLGAAVPRQALLSRLLFGHAEAELAAAAAAAKAEGRKLPPPSAIARFRRNGLFRRAILVAAPVALISSVIGIVGYEPVEKWLKSDVGEEFEKAAASGECAPMELFSTQYPGSPWADEAVEYLARCKREPKQVEEVERLKARAGQIDLRPVNTEREARIAGRQALDRIAGEYCGNHAKNLRASLKPVTLEDVKDNCKSDYRGWTCEYEAWAVCRIQRTEPAQR